MSTLEDASLVPIPEGAWQLDVDPVSEEQQLPAEIPADAAPASRSMSPTESTPPPLHHILESMLFAATEPLTSEQLCTIIRGLTAGHLEDTLRTLNFRYRRQGRPYAIVTQPTGYRMTLRTPFRFHLESLYGSVKEARFSQLAIETLAIVAYRQPLTQPEVEGILGQDAGLPLRQLVRRGMIQVQTRDNQDQSSYSTTARFLDYFALTKIDDLPRADDLERL
ncbi:MAG: SMC-Scp complex subunit ScpB [Gemmatales bacterium]